VSALVVVGIGLLIGLAARRFIRGRAPEAFVTSAVLGISGAMSATMLGAALDWYMGGAAGFTGAAIGAVVTLTAYRLFSERLD